MEKILHLLPLGETMRDRFQEQGRQAPYGDVLLLVPSRYFRQKIREETKGSVLTAGIDYLPQEILRLGGGDTFQTVSRPVQRKVLEQALDKLRPQLEYFAPLVGKNGFVDSLLTLMDEFSRTSLTPQTFHGIMLSWDREGALRQKDMELDKIFLVYSAQMEALQVKDLSAQYTLAAELLEKGLDVPWKRCLFSEFYQFSPVQLDLIQALAKRTNVEIGLFYDTSRPDLTAVTEKIYDALLGKSFTPVSEAPRRKKPEDLALFAEKWQPGARTETACTHILLGEAQSPETEIHLALQQMKKQLAEGAAPEDIVLLVRNLADYQGLARSFAAYGIPCRLNQVTDRFGQPLPDFLTKLFAAAPQKNNTEAWQDLFRCPLAETVLHVDREALEQVYCERYFPSQKALLDFLQKQQLVDAPFWDLLDFLQGSHTAAQWRETFLQVLDSCNLPAVWGSAYQKGHSTLRQVKAQMETLDFVRQFFKELAETWEQCGLETQPLALKEVRDFWEDAKKSGKTQTIADGTTNGILVAEAAELQGASFPYVYLLGVREGLFPQIKRESWLYNDDERAQLNALGLQLSLSARALEEDRFFFASAVALGEKNVYLSWYRDEEGGESSYIRSLQHFYGGGMPDPVAYTPKLEQCASFPLLLNFLADQKNPGESEKITLAENLGENFLARTDSARKRWENADNPWNGETENLVKRPLHVSASSLDSYLACPFAYLTGTLWKLQPWQERTPYPWPDAVGNLVHGTLARFMGNHLGEVLDSPEKLWPELENIYEENFSALVEQGQIPESPLLPFIKHTYAQWLRTVLEKECGYEIQSAKPFTARKVEWSFGRKYSKWPALVKEVAGEKVYISGQMDRVDSDGTSYFILDYKTGQIPGNTDIKKGKAVQLPLYLEALETLGKIPKEKILGAGYVNVRKGVRKGGAWAKEGKKQLAWRQNARPAEMSQAEKAMEASLAAAAEGMLGGHFPASPAGKCPAWCPAKDICRIQENPKQLGEE